MGNCVVFRVDLVHSPVVPLCQAGGRGEGLLWAGAGVYGLGMASVFPAAFMQAEALVDLSGRAASALMVGSATGEMVVPLVVGLATAAWPPGFVVVVAAATAAFSAAAAVLVSWPSRPHASPGGGLSGDLDAAVVVKSEGRSPMEMSGVL